MTFELIQLIVSAVLSTLGLIATLCVVLIFYIKGKVKPTEQENMEHALNKVDKAMESACKKYKLDIVNVLTNLVVEHEKEINQQEQK